MNKIIFLDIDGVLNCAHSTSRISENSNIVGIDDDKLKLLKELIDKTDSKIVLISTWKTLYNDSDQKKYMMNKFKEYNIEIFDQTIDKMYDRGAGIYLYLESNKVDQYIIIDDDIFKDYDNELMNHLIKTSFSEGFIKKHLSLALNKLSQ